MLHHAPLSCTPLQFFRVDKGFVAQVADVSSGRQVHLNAAQKVKRGSGGTSRLTRRARHLGCGVQSTWIPPMQQQPLPFQQGYTFSPVTCCDPCNPSHPCLPIRHLPSLQDPTSLSAWVSDENPAYCGSAPRQTPRPALLADAFALVDTAPSVASRSPCCLKCSGYLLTGDVCAGACRQDCTTGGNARRQAPCRSVTERAHCGCY
jgi:hypothetical protein